MVKRDSVRIEITCRWRSNNSKSRLGHNVLLTYMRKTTKRMQANGRGPNRGQERGGVDVTKERHLCDGVVQGRVQHFIRIGLEPLNGPQRSIYRDLQNSRLLVRETLPKYEKMGASRAVKTCSIGHVRLPTRGTSSWWLREPTVRHIAT